MWDGQQWHLQPTRAARSWPATPLLEDGAGNLIMSAVDRYVNLAGDGGLPFPFSRIEITSWTSGAAADNAGRVWIGARDHFYVHEPPRLLQIPTVRGLLLRALTRSDGSVWLVTFAGAWLARGPGLDRPGILDPETIEVTQVELPVGLEILSATVTRDDVLILGLLGQGLLTVTPSASLLIDARPYLLHPDTLSRTVHSVVSDTRGGLWISRDCGDIARLTGSALESLNRPSATLLRTYALEDDCVRSLHLTQGGALLAGVPHGLLRIHPGEDTLDRIRLPESSTPDPGTLMAQPAPTSYLELGPDSIMVGTSDGRLLLLTPRNTVLPWPGWDPMDGGIGALARTDDGILWIGAEGRLWSIQPDGSIRPDRAIPDRSPLEPIRVLLPESGGGLWMGRYGGGLTYRSPNGVRTPVPLADQTLSSILVSDDGSFWIAQNSGIAILRPDLVEAVRQGRAFTPISQRLLIQDGVPETNNGRPAGVRLPSGLMAIGTVNGLLLVDPSAVPATGVSPTIRLENIRTASGTWSLKNGRLELPATERILEVELAIPSFRSSDAIQLRYRISTGGIRGRSGEWINLAFGEPLRLGGLEAGRRRLEVEAIVPGGAWVAAEPLDFRVHPLLMERRSVQLGLALLIFILVMLLIQGRIRERDQKRSLAMERRLEAERERHLGELALMGRHSVAGELTASLAHEMGQPLTAMLQTASAVKAEMEVAPLSPEAMNDTMEELVGQIHRARNVLQGMRRFLRSETPQIELLDLAEVVEEVRELMRRELHEARVTLDIEAPDEPVSVAGERVLIQQTLIILLSNAKDAVEGLPIYRRTLRLRIKAVQGGGRITVQDGGRGITPEKLRTLFEPFQTTKSKGMGMGLPIARRIVRSHRGVIRIRSLEGSGTVVSVWLPATTRKGDHPPV